MFLYQFVLSTDFIYLHVRAHRAISLAIDSVSSVATVLRGNWEKYFVMGHIACLHMTNGLNMVELCVLLMDAGCQLVYCMILICNDLRIGFYFPKVRRRRQWQYHTVINWYNASLFRVVALSSFVFLIHLLVIQSPKIVHKWDRPKYIAVQIQWKRNDSFIRCCCCRWTIGWVNKLFDRHRFCAKRSFLHIRNKLKLMMKRRRGRRDSVGSHFGIQ